MPEQSGGAQDSAPSDSSGGPSAGDPSRPEPASAPAPESVRESVRSSGPPAAAGNGHREPAAPETQNRAGAPSRPARGRIQRFLRSLRRPRNGEQIRDTIGELLDDAGGPQAPMAADERRLIHNILQLHDLTVRDVMVPRADITAVDLSTGLPELIERARSETHSRLPVYRGTLDEIVGMVHIKDVLPYWSKRRSFKLEKIVRKALFAAPSMSVLDLLAEMRDTRIHLALVVDEYGGIDGLVTIEDLVEEIVGEIEDEHDDAETPKIEEVRPGIAEADARARLEDLEALYGDLLTDEERDDIDTIGGLVFLLANRVPTRGELIPHSSGIELEVLEADPRRIHRVRLRRLPARRAEDGSGH